ncbi:ABC transporter substrate-binding protein [Clostridia bacterium]|nr:ABC transporter substrate-binding protein [Clostridia bacterium]
MRLNTYPTKILSVCLSLFFLQGAIQPQFTALAALSEYTAKEAETSYLDYKGIYAATAENAGEQANGVRVLSGADTDEWEVELAKSGNYCIEVTYTPVAGRGKEIEKAVYIDGVSPFSEAKNISFQRVFTDAGAITQNNKGDDVQPGQVEIIGEYTQVLQDYQGYYSEPFGFYMAEGKHTITFNAVRDSMAISAVRVFAQNTPVTYEEYLRKYAGVKEISGFSQMLQAENAVKKSSSSLSPAVDRSSEATIPNAPDKKKINVISGTNWKLPGQWLSWNIDAPESGLYKISLRWLQNEISGFSSSRKIYVDGVIPFAEAANIKFPYTTKWTVTTLGNENNEPYLFYLEKGVHEIRVEATTGAMADLIARADESLSALNTAYRRMAQLTGANPDANRDYELELYVPEALTSIGEQRHILSGILDDLIVYGSVGGGQSGAELQRVITQIDKMLKRVDKIPKRLGSFKADLSGLADWLVKALNQPLTLDYIVISSPEISPPKAENGFFANVWYEIRMFLASFGDNNNYNGDAVTDGETISVWIGNGAVAGRDQAQLLRKLLDNYFTPQSGINVNLKLVAPGSLLPATFAGQGPDVSLQMNTSDVVNYGLRTALTDLTEFSDFAEIEGRFAPQAWIPYGFDGQIFGVPETQNFPMLFYRHDILQGELGYAFDGALTWDDILIMLPKILKQNMWFWIAPEPTSYFFMLKQYGGDFYRNDSLYTALDTQEAFKAFKFYTDFFNAYKLEKKMDFMNRFRTGEAPIGIADYTMANALSILAPEIRGLWDFMPIPGVQKEDGTINNAGYLGTSGCVLLAQSENKEASWEFIKWWTGTEAQSLFGREIESIVGPAGRYPTANLEAFASLPWSDKELAELSEQLAVSVPRREMPGGYYTERQVKFAIRSVIIDGNNARESLLDYAMKIDEEIKAKADDLGIDMNTKYGGVY